MNGEKTKAPYNQQQFGGTVGGPLIKDKLFYFGSYERRRERSQVVVTSPEAFGLVVPTPADEHQGHAKMDLRFSEKNTLGVRYNMVRWKKDNESGGLQLPGTGFIWDNNVDTIHGTFTTVVSQRFLNEVRGQYSRYTDRRAAKCDCVSIQRAGYSTEGGYDFGTWGVLPEETYDLSDSVSLWMGNHSMKMGGSFTYDVTEQLYQPLQNGVYLFTGSPAVAPPPFQYQQSFALVPEAALMFPKAYVLSGFLQDDWHAKSNLTLNLGIRYDVEIIKDIPDWPAGTDKNNVDPRIGFAWDPKGDQKWAVRGGVGRFTQQYAIFTIVKGGVGGRNGQVTVTLTPTDPLFPTFPNTLPAFPPGAVLPPRDIQEISPISRTSMPGRPASAFKRQLGPRTSLAVDANMNRGVKHGFLDMNQAAPIPKDVLNAALASNPNGVFRTQAQADATRPITPVPNGFRRMDLLTNEGRSWYQGVRIALRASHHPAHHDRLVYALEVGGSPEPLVLAGEQRRSRTRSRTDGRRHAAQPGDQLHVEPARLRSRAQRLAPQRGIAPPERLAVHDPIRRRSHRRRIDRWLQQPGLPVQSARAHATPPAATSSTTPT